MFDSIIKEAQDKLNLGDGARSLLASLLGLIAAPASGGLRGFIDRFRAAGLGATADSWVTTGDNAHLSGVQVESALGAETIDAVAAQAGLDRAAVRSGLALMTPHVVDALTPNGELPAQGALLARVGEFLRGHGGAAGAALFGDAGAGGRAVDAARPAAVAAGGDSVDGESPGGFLRLLIPLVLLGILIALGYMFCTTKSTPLASVPNANRPAANAAANAAARPAANALDASLRIEARDGRYFVSGVVPDRRTLDEIKAKLDAQFGAANVDYAGLRVEAGARPFAAGWWDNFQKLLPNLKDWKTGALAFTGSAVTAADGLPAATLDALRSLFAGWSLPAATAGAAAATNRTLAEVSLPDGTKLQAYPGGIEDQLVRFIGSGEYRNATADALKNKWFAFDDLNFKFGTSELVPESKRQLENIVAILKAFPDVKIKIGGYTDKKGDDAQNKKLSEDRAQAVRAALEKAGVGAQVPEAEGYGEQFATVPETAGDEERQADRRTSVRLLK